MLQILNDEGLVTCGNGIALVSEDIRAESIRLESTVIVTGNIEVSELVANYALYVIGNVKAEKAHILTDFVCVGNVQVDELLVQGDLLCKGRLEARQYLCGGNCTVTDFLVSAGEVQGSLTTLKGGFIAEHLSVEKTIFSYEGVSGTGILAAGHAVVNDYCDVQCDDVVTLSDEPKQVIAPLTTVDFHKDVLSYVDEGDRLSREHQNIIRSCDEFLQSAEEVLSFDDILERLRAFASCFRVVQPYSDAFAQVMDMSALSAIEDLETFLRISYLQVVTPESLFRVSIVSDLLNDFYARELPKVEDLPVTSDTVLSIGEQLNLLQEMREHFDDGLFHLVEEKLITKMKSVILGE